MAESFYNDRDSVDISELAALNDDISDDLINKLQQQLTENLPKDNQNIDVNKNDDTALFKEAASGTKLPEAINTDAQAKNTTEEAQNNQNQVVPDDSSIADNEKKDKPEVNKSFDDNFIKKYKAKLLKKSKGGIPGDVNPVSYGGVAPEETNTENNVSKTADNTPIESLSQGNITERPLTNELKNYNDSLDFLDGNVKYSKYVIYIDPENTDFIEGLTVKERKNLINGILRQQNDIAITKKRFRVMQAVVRHAIILILTIAISIPVVYHVINASLEATINNHRYAQTNWQALYRENGKITRN